MSERDMTHEELAEIVDAPESIKASAKVIDLMEALKASLAEAREHDEEKAREKRIASCTRCDGHGWLTSWEDRVRCDCNPEVA